MSAPSCESVKNHVPAGTANHRRSEPAATGAALHLSDPLQLAGAKKESNKDLLKHSTSSADAGDDKFNESSNGLPPLGKATAFAQFVQQGWEAYMNDPNADAAFPLQLLCGGSGRYDRLVGPYAPLPDGHLLAPAALRHTHSSPLKYGAPIFAQYGDDVPPPIPLDPFQRSSSTPSSFRHKSTNSAFTDRVPSQRVSYTSVISKPDYRLSAFDPVKYYARALEDMERTSIEVTEATPGRRKEPDEASATGATAEVNSRVGAAARAARFLSDVRMLRRRRRALGGRDNPATPASNSSSSGAAESTSKAEESHVLDTSVTVITETNAPETSIMSQSSELSALLNNENETDETTKSRSSVMSETDRDIGKGPSSESEPYHRLDSDVDEEEIHFRSLYESSESPGPVPSPAYLPMIDERVPSSERPSKPKTQEKPIAAVAMSTPSPTRMNREGSTTPRSNDSANLSPGTRSSATGSSSGHTTQATLSTLSSGQLSGLSTISETDREVMQANSDGKRRRRGLETLRTLNNKSDPNPAAAEAQSLNSSSTTTASNPGGYIALTNSPIPLREGANVPADRFFTHSPSNSSTLAPRSANRSTVPLRRTGQTGSPGTVETASESHTTLSGSNTDEVPTKFVSYADREGASDLTSVREGVEVSTKRGDSDKTEEREDSPAEFVKFPELIFANAGATSPIVGPLSAKSQRYRATRPPRTPTKGLLPRSTPPPRVAVSPLNQQSPPRNAVDHSSDRGSRPSTSVALESMPVDESLVDSSPQPDGPLLYIPAGYNSPTHKDGESHGAQLTRVVRGRTYADGSVEILKASSPNASPPTLVTPEKNVD